MHDAPGKGANGGARLAADRNEIGHLAPVLFRHADPGASHAASWLVRRFGVKPLLAETLAGLAGLGEARHGR
jgi:hypothetical protein